MSAKSAVSKRASLRWVRFAPPAGADRPRPPGLGGGSSVHQRVLEQLLDRLGDGRCRADRVLVPRDDEQRPGSRPPRALRRRRCTGSCFRARCSRPRSGSRRSSGCRCGPPDPSKTGGVGWLEQEVHRLLARSGSGCPSGSSRRAGERPSSSGEYQSAGASPDRPAAARRACPSTGSSGRSAPVQARSGTSSRRPSRTGPGTSPAEASSVPTARRDDRRCCRGRTPTGCRCSTAPRTRTVPDRRSAVLGDAEVVVLEEASALASREVELVDQQDVGLRPLDDLGHRSSPAGFGRRRGP